MFESDFLTITPASMELYREQMARVAELLCSSLPDHSYSGKSPSALTALIDPEFLPDAGAAPEAAVDML